MASVACVDCIREGVESYRPAAKGAARNRCATHHRAVVKAAKVRKHENHIALRYNLPEGDYNRLYEYQGRKCYICHRANGSSKNLAVDHQHAHCPGPKSCGKCVRGLACSKCNWMLSHARDDINFFQRAIDYLTYPPYKRMLDGVPKEGSS